MDNNLNKTNFALIFCGSVNKAITRKSPAPHSSLRQRVFYFVLVLSWAARFVYSPMQLVTPSVVPIAVRMVTSVWIMVFQIVFLSISLIDN